VHLLLNALHRTLQARYLHCSGSHLRALSSSKSTLLPPIEHANAFWHQELHLSRCSELGIWSHTGLNLVHGIFTTLSGHMHVLTHHPARQCMTRQTLGIQRPQEMPENECIGTPPGVIWPGPPQRVHPRCTLLCIFCKH
jgi:hypothetical protein